MIPVNCRVKHDPDAGTYGDCIRACIASVLELDAEAVPHFAHDNPDENELWSRIRAWLRLSQLSPFIIQYPPMPLAELLIVMGQINPDAHYLLFGGTASGNDHVVVCHGGELAHNPAWYGGSIVAPTSLDMWQVVVLTRI